MNYYRPLWPFYGCKGTEKIEKTLIFGLKIAYQFGYLEINN